uniref:Uncharacterized protein n=1 Tax=Anguilla anguilla TaxID=7936 RepID=A0A0E9X2H6_ANGAN
MREIHVRNTRRERRSYYRMYNRNKLQGSFLSFYGSAAVRKAVCKIIKSHPKQDVPILHHKQHFLKTPRLPIPQY